VIPKWNSSRDSAMPISDSSEEEARRFATSKEDFEDRLEDLQRTYERTDKAFNRLNRHLNRRGDYQFLNREKNDWKIIQTSEKQHLDQASEYLEGLTVEKLIAGETEFKKKIRGLHHSIKQLGNYRRHYEEIWASPNEIERAQRDSQKELSGHQSSNFDEFSDRKTETLTTNRNS
jgi:hypothetical protein